jgi:hypothetical protein
VILIVPPFFIYYDIFILALAVLQMNDVVEWEDVDLVADIVEVGYQYRYCRAGPLSNPGWQHPCISSSGVKGRGGGGT